MIIATEVFVFLKACVLGAFFGLFFDVFRIIRLSFKNPKLLVFIEDVLYFSIITLASFTFIVVENNGYLRAFLLIGELLGLILYFFTLSILIMKSAKAIIKVVKKILRFIYKFTLKPFVVIFCKIKDKLKEIISNNKIKLKNINLKAKNHLK